MKRRLGYLFIMVILSGMFSTYSQADNPIGPIQSNPNIPKISDSTGNTTNDIAPKTTNPNVIKIPKEIHCEPLFIPQSAGKNQLKATDVTDAQKFDPANLNQDWKIFDHVGYKDNAFSGERHIVMRNEGIQFYGYQIPGYKNWMYKEFGSSYPKRLSSTQYPVRADWHTVEGSGVMFNAKLNGDNLSFYAVVSTMDSVEVRKYNSVSAQAFLTGSAGGFEILFSENRPCPAQNINIDWNKDSAVISIGNKELFKIESMTYFGDGAGPLVSFLDHNCNSLSSTLFTSFIIDGTDHFKKKN